MNRSKLLSQPDGNGSVARELEMRAFETILLANMHSWCFAQVLSVYPRSVPKTITLLLHFAVFGVWLLILRALVVSPTKFTRRKSRQSHLISPEMRTKRRIGSHCFSVGTF